MGNILQGKKSNIVITCIFCLKVFMENSHNTDVENLLDMVILELRKVGGTERNMETCCYEVNNSWPVESIDTVSCSC